ncbi:MAG: class I SAM-dependent methyltransferase [Phycisphaerae bacterium]
MATAPATRDRCPVCDVADLRDCPFETTHLRAPAGRVVRACRACTHRFLHPPYSRDEVAQQYTADYYHHFESGAGMAGDRAGQVADHLTARLAELASQTPGRRLLDIGCGKGALLAHAAAAGWTVHGVDVSADAVQFVRDIRRLPATRGELDEIDFPAGAFDVVHANHVVEHLRDPCADLRSIRRWLAPSGRLAIEVPNEFENLFFALGRRLLPASRMVRADPSPHVQFFSPRSLRAALERAGFDVARLFTRRWEIGTGSRLPVRALKRGVAQAERLLGRGGNIIAVATPSLAADTAGAGRSN